ncbi:MAG: GTP-binding protein [Candidatus Freyarchaeota archaeon]|nr:GTP-binding protein [Candidatus Jordarchaeia archaeon]
MSENRRILKIVVVGNCSSGKTCLVKRYTEGVFPEYVLMTVGVSFGVKSLNIDGQPIKLQIWDLGGVPHFKDVRLLFYKYALGAVYVFDVNIRETFERLDEWRKEVAEVCGNIPGVIVGSKVDLHSRKVTRSEGKRYAKSVGMPYIEASARTGKNVNEVFWTIASLIAKK